MVLQAGTFTSLQPRIPDTVPLSCTPLPGDPEFPAQRRHTLAVLQSNHEADAFVYHRTFPPWRVLSCLAAGDMRYPCLRNVLLPMSRVGQCSLRGNPKTIRRRLVGFQNPQH